MTKTGTQQDDVTDINKWRDKRKRRAVRNSNADVSDEFLAEYAKLPRDER